MVDCLGMVVGPRSQCLRSEECLSLVLLNGDVAWGLRPVRRPLETVSGPPGAPWGLTLDPCIFPYHRCYSGMHGGAHGLRGTSTLHLHAVLSLLLAHPSALRVAVRPRLF